MNGSEPDENSIPYTGTLKIQDVIIQPDSELNFKIKAFKEGFSPSQTISRSFSYLYEQSVLEPEISIGGNYPQHGTQVIISCDSPEARIHYTINGSIPNQFSALYTRPITLNYSGPHYIQARAFKDEFNPSSVAMQYHFIQHPVQPEVFVQGGVFSNGTSNITLNSYYIDKYEVTQREYNDVMSAVLNFHEDAKMNYPVYYVSWLDAIEYCNRRSILEELQPCYTLPPYGNHPNTWPPGWKTNPNIHNQISCNWDNAGYRLPTEMEWMYAARGGLLSKGYQYCGNDSISIVAWYNGNSGHSVQRVGTKYPNELGIHDMSGNLWEWCWDIYGTYPLEDQTNPRGPASGASRVLRGGSYYTDADSCRPTNRYSYDPAYYLAASFGFRCVRKAN